MAKPGLTQGDSMLTEEERRIAQKIGAYYLAQMGDYEKACDAIEQLGIASLTVQEGKVTIKLARPGRLIGLYGNNIDALQNYLGSDYKICIIEDDLWGWLLPPDPGEPEDYWA
jgi:hypothetical protein